MNQAELAPITLSTYQAQMFIAYVEDMERKKIFAVHNVSHHCFVDNTQSYTDAPLPQARTEVDKLQRCIVDVADWSGSRRLQLNPTKTELMWFGSSTSLQSVSSLDRSNRSIGEDIIQPSNSVSNLGVLFDSEINMRA